MNLPHKPRVGVLVDIAQACPQCSKALLRSQRWDAAHQVDPAALPTGGQVHRAIQGAHVDAEAHEQARAERYRQQVGSC